MFSQVFVCPQGGLGLCPGVPVQGVSIQGGLCLGSLSRGVSAMCGSDLHMEMRILSCTEISKRATKVNFFTPCYLPPANKVCDGYVFTQVFVCPRGGGSRSLSRGPRPGGLHPGGLCLGSLSRGVSAKESLFRGVSVQGGLCSGVSLSRETPRTVTGGRYASYWNAFLFTLFCCSICPGCITIWS